ATSLGLIKKTKLSEFQNIRSTGIWAIKLEDDDKLISVRALSGQEELMMITEKGMAIRFATDDVRAMGRTAKGVRGIKLNKGDKVISMDLINDEEYLLVVSENGYGKKTLLEHYTAQNR